MPYRVVDPASEAPRACYRLLTSLVVPRPIGWVSTWGASGTPNLAPFSYFTALSSSPMLVGVSIGTRRGALKDTLVNVRERGAFCVNLVDAAHLEAMNATSAEVGPEIDEFGLAGLPVETSEAVDAPYVGGCPAVLACRVSQEVELLGSTNTLVVGEVVEVLVRDDVPFLDGSLAVDPAVLRPVGRLGGDAYAMPGEIRLLARPS